MDMPLRLDKAGEVDIEAVVFHPYFMRWGASRQWSSLFRAFYHHSVGSRLQGRGQEQGTVLIVTDKRAYNPHFFLVQGRPGPLRIHGIQIHRIGFFGKHRKNGPCIAAYQADFLLENVPDKCILHGPLQAVF